MDLVSIIAALGGTAGIVAIINAIRNPSTNKLREVLQEENDIQNKTLIDELNKQKDSTTVLLRHEITNLYYKKINVKELTQFEKQDLISLFELYTSLGGNSYVHQLYNEMMNWN